MKFWYLLYVFVIIISPLKPMAQPDVSFEVSRHKVCSGSTIDFINTSTGANSFQWFIDGVFYSSSIDTVATLFESCYDVIFIRLIGCDSISSMCDSFTTNVEVFDSCFFHWTADILACPGDTLNRDSHPEAIHTNWDVQPPVNYLVGCDTCPSITFVMTQNNTTIDLTNTYQGNCLTVTTYHYFCQIQYVDEIENLFFVYPNPFSEKISITNSKNLDIERYVLMNVNGQKVKEGDLINNELFVSDIPPGMYYFILFYKSKNGLSRIFKLIEKM